MQGKDGKKLKKECWVLSYSSNGYSEKQIGNKATNLLKLHEAGILIPDGFIVYFPNGFCDNMQIQEAIRRELSRREWYRKGMKIIIRSSSPNEDGEKSFAGVFCSMVCDPDNEELQECLFQVISSYTLDSQYREKYARENKEEARAIIVQQLLKPDFSGVMYTWNPINKKNEMLIECVSGGNEMLTQGKRSPVLYIWDRKASNLIAQHTVFKDDELPWEDLLKVIEYGERIEEVFGQKQDIEWAIVDGCYYALQARTITVGG